MSLNVAKCNLGKVKIKARWPAWLLLQGACIAGSRGVYLGSARDPCIG